MTIRVEAFKNMFNLTPRIRLNGKPPWPKIWIKKDYKKRNISTVNIVENDPLKSIFWRVWRDLVLATWLQDLEPAAQHALLPRKVSSSSAVFVAADARCRTKRGKLNQFLSEDFLESSGARPKIISAWLAAALSFTRRCKRSWRCKASATKCCCFRSSHGFGLPFLSDHK